MGSMNYIRRFAHSDGDVQNMINRYVHKNKKEVVIVTNIMIESNTPSDLICTLNCYTLS